MALVDIETFKSYANVNRGTDIADDALLTSVLAASESWVTTHCARTFQIAGVTATDRTYVPTDSTVLEIDDAVAVTAIVANGSAITGWQLEPLNTTDPYGAETPYSQVRSVAGWWYGGWPGQATVTVTGRWGWLAIPAQVTMACLIRAKDILDQQRVSFGIAQFTEYAGVRTKLNPEVVELLRPYRRVRAFGPA